MSPSLPRRRLLHFIVPLFSLFYFVFSQSAQGEEIRSFDVDIQAFEDSSFLVTEKIDYDFGKTERHGIHRVIPIVYTRNNSDYKIELRLGEVIDDSGTPYEVEKIISGQKVNIKIGSPAFTLKGRHIITVQYTVRKGVNFFEGVPEICWNVTGHDWQVPINRVSCTIHPPRGVKGSSIKYSSYTGRDGKREIGIGRLVGDSVVFESQSLQPGEHLTAVVGFPDGSILKPGYKLGIYWWLEDWWPAIVVPLFSAFALGAIYFKFGRDPIVDIDSSSTRLFDVFQVVQKLRPAQVGTLIDERCDMHDIVATLIDLGSRGFLKVKQLSRDDPYGFDGPSVQFVKVTDVEVSARSNLLKFEKEFFAGIFEVEGKEVESAFLTDLKFNFQSRLSTIRDDIYSGLTSSGYFQTNPHEERSVYYSVALILFGAGALLLFLGIEVASSIAWAVGLLLSAAMAYAAAPVMPSKTEKGVVLVSHTLKFARLIQHLTESEIEALLTERPSLFSEVLPYAMVLGLEDRWATLCAPFIKEAPHWYEALAYFGASHPKGFDASSFIVDLGANIRTMQSHLMASPPPPPTVLKGSSSLKGGTGFGEGGFGGDKPW